MGLGDQCCRLSILPAVRYRRGYELRRATRSLVVSRLSWVGPYLDPLTEVQPNRCPAAVQSVASGRKPSQLVAGGRYELIARTPSWCLRFRRASLQRVETPCDIPHQMYVAGPGNYALNIQWSNLGATSSFIATVYGYQRSLPALLRRNETDCDRFPTFCARRAHRFKADRPVNSPGISGGAALVHPSGPSTVGPPDFRHRVRLLTCRCLIRRLPAGEPSSRSHFGPGSWTSPASSS